MPPKRTGTPGFVQPGLAVPILTSQSEVPVLPSPSITPTQQEPVKPITVEWSAVTDFGKIIFYVDGTGTWVKRISYLFSNWTCGSIPQSGEIVDASRWLIVDNQLTVETTFGREMKLIMVLNGTYDETNQKMVGTWEEFSQGVKCSGTFEATVPPVGSTVSPQPSGTALPTATQAP